MIVRRLLSLSVFLVIIFISCSSDTESYDSIDMIPEVTTEFLFEITGSSDVTFSRISDLKVSSNGTIIVADALANRIHLFDSDGNFLSTALREGRGPGEVQNLLGRITLSDDDRLLIYDQSLRRLSIFDLENDQLQPSQDLSLERNASFFHLLNNKIYLYSSTSIASTDGDGRDRLLELDTDGTVLRSSIATFQRSDELMITTESMSMGMSTEYHEKNHVGFNDNKMVQNRSNQIGFTLYDLKNGEIIQETHLNRPQKVLQTSVKKEYVDNILESGFIPKSKRSQLLSDMPEFEPVVQTLKYDSDGTVWLKINEAKNTGWLLFSDESGEPIGRLFSELDGNLISVHNSHLFVANEDEEGYPKLRIYRYGFE